MSVEVAMDAVDTVAILVVFSETHNVLFPVFW